MKRLKRVFGSVKNLTKNEFGGSTSSVLSRLASTKSIASKSSLESRDGFNTKDGSYMGYDFQSSPLHGSHLIDYADPLNSLDHASTRLHRYCFHGDVSRVKKFLKKVNINSQDSEGRTPLHLAAAAGHLEVVMLLMGEKVNPEIEDYDGRTAFLIAVERNRLEIVHIFLNYKVDAVAKDKYGNQAIHLAARTGAKDVIDLLIDAGLDVNAVNVLDQTPMHVATENLNMDVIKSLLSCQVNVNAVDKEFVTCLMLAAKTGSNPLIDSLLECGADLHLVDSSSWNAAAYAKYSMHEELEHKLLALMSCDVREGNQDYQSHSLDRVSNKHIRSISDSYDSWTESSMSESQKLKLTYFNTENSSASKTLPRQKFSDSSLGPPKPPRLYTSTPNLDMNEKELEENMKLPVSSRQSLDNKELSNDNTIKSNITFENEENSLLDVSLQSTNDDSISGKQSEGFSKHSKSSPFRSHSLSPKSSVSESSIVPDRRVDCNLEHVSHSDKTSTFSNKDKLNEIEEVWETNAHLSPITTAQSHSFSDNHSDSGKNQASKNDMNVGNPVYDGDAGYDNNSYSTQRNADSNLIPSIGISSPVSMESPKKFEERKSDESSFHLLLSASTPTTRDELQILVRKLRSALNDVNVSSKAKDHSLASLRKSESFLKRQLKEIEKKTSDLAEQNSNFMLKLENLQSKTSALKDEANSVCYSLEESKRGYSETKYASRDFDAAEPEFSANGILDDISKLKNITAVHNDNSVSKKSSLRVIKEPQKPSSYYDSHIEALHTDQMAEPCISQEIIEAASNLSNVAPSEAASQTELVEQTLVAEAETQTEIGRHTEGETCSVGINTDPYQPLNKNEECSKENSFMNMFNTAMAKWKVTFEETSTRLHKSLIDASSRDELINEINERLDRLNEQVPHYGEGVKTAIQSSLSFNDDLYKRLSSIEETCNSVAELKHLPHILKARDQKYDDILKEKDRKYDDILTNITQLKQKLGASLDCLETSVNINNSLTLKLSDKLDDKIDQHMESIKSKIAAIEYSFNMMQNTLTEKVLMFCNVSDEIKEVSCGMRRISDNYGAMYDSTGDERTKEGEAFSSKLTAMCAKFEEIVAKFGATLELLKEGLFTKLNSFIEMPNQNVGPMNEMAANLSDLNFKISQLSQSQTLLSEKFQFKGIENYLLCNEKSIAEVKLCVQSVYDLIKTFDQQRYDIHEKESLHRKSENMEKFLKKESIGNSRINGSHTMISKETANTISNTRDSFAQTDGELDLNYAGDLINDLENENRILVAENELLQKHLSLNQPANQAVSESSSNSTIYELTKDKDGMEEDLKSMKKVNRELNGKISILETDCDELEEELELRNKEMQNQQKIYAIQKKELKEMRHQLAIVASLQNEKFTLEEQAIRLEHSELEYKKIIEQLRTKILELTRENAELCSKIDQTEVSSAIKKQVGSRMSTVDDAFPPKHNAGKGSDVDSLFATVDCHFQTLVSKKLKELNEMLEERLPQDRPMKESSSFENYQSEMIKLQREIISMKEDVEKVDCDKELWHAKYDDLHARYQQLQRSQPFVCQPVVEEDNFEKVLENIEEQLKVTYPTSRFIESGHPDSDYFSSLRYSTNSGSSSFEPKIPERSFLSVLRPNFPPVQDCSPPSYESGHTVIPLYPRSEISSAACAVVHAPGSSVEQSCERYMNFLQVKHSV